MPASLALAFVASERPVRSVSTVRPAVVRRLATAAPIAPGAITATMGSVMVDCVVVTVQVDGNLIIEFADRGPDQWPPQKKAGDWSQEDILQSWKRDRHFVGL